MDVLCVREATKFAADHCRSGKVSSVLRRDEIRNQCIYFPIMFVSPQTLGELRITQRGRSLKCESKILSSV